MPDNTRRARDEAFWQTFADRYDVEPGPVNLENGYFGRMSRTVVEEYQRNIELINRSNSVYARQRFEQDDKPGDPCATGRADWRPRATASP